MSLYPYKLNNGAIAQAKAFEQSDFNELPLRLYCEGKGCDGFRYGVAFTDVEPEDLHFYIDGLWCVVDLETLPFVFGSEISWVDDERGKGFLVENPRHKYYRGKFFKRKGWQDRQPKVGEEPTSTL